MQVTSWTQSHNGAIIDWFYAVGHAPGRNTASEQYLRPWRWRPIFSSPDFDLVERQLVPRIFEQGQKCRLRIAGFKEEKPVQ